MRLHTFFVKGAAIIAAVAVATFAAAIAAAAAAAAAGPEHLRAASRALVRAGDGLSQLPPTAAAPPLSQREGGKALSDAGRDLAVAYETLYGDDSAEDCDWEQACTDGLSPAAAQLRVAGAKLQCVALSDAATSLNSAAEVGGCIVMAAAAADDLDACGRSLQQAGRQDEWPPERQVGDSLVEAGAAFVAFAAYLSLGRAAAATAAAAALVVGLSSLFTPATAASAAASPVVHVYHYIDTNMGHPFTGEATGCGTPPGHRCMWRSSNSVATLAAWHADDAPALSVSVYNIHLNHTEPQLCTLPTNVTLAESEESRRHRTPSTNKAMESNFDGYSTTHNRSSVQRAYREVWSLDASSLLPQRPFADMIPGASFIASNCQPRSPRHELVTGLRARGVRVDGLAKCLATPNITESVELGVVEKQDQKTNYARKKAVLGRYMFTVAAENDVEPWHVTEKVVHAWDAGTVPVYLGADELKYLLPHPKAAIFVSDFHSDVALAGYLINLTRDAAAYEEHRAWRATFTRSAYLTQQRRPDLAVRSWHCRVCDWARTATPTPRHRAQIAACNAPFYATLIMDAGGVFAAHWRYFVCGAAVWACCSAASIVWLRRRRRRREEKGKI